MSLEQAYNTKHVIGTNIQQEACHWNKHTTLSMSLEQTYNTKHVIGTNIEQTYKTKHVIGTNIQH